MPPPGVQPTCTWSGRAWRYTEWHREPLDTTGSRLHGGRWNPAGIFPALYLGTSEQVVLEDLAAAARVLGLAADYRLGFALHEVRIDGLRLLDLRTTSGREAVGMLDADMVDDDRTACQRVGRSAWEAGLQGVLAPSVTGAGLVLAVFPDRAPRGALAVHRSAPLPQQ